MEQITDQVADRLDRRQIRYRQGFF